MITLHTHLLGLLLLHPVAVRFGDVPPVFQVLDKIVRAPRALDFLNRGGELVQAFPLVGS